MKPRRWSMPVGYDAADDTLGQRGLWRVVREDAGLVKTFDRPARVFVSERGAAELEAEVWEWARASSSDELPLSWVAPEAGEVRAWLDPRRLQVRSGACVARGELDIQADRLRLRFPELVRLPDSFSGERGLWLRELCIDTQTRWKLVRFGVREGWVGAEVDLSGVPSVLAEPLFGIALEALVFSVAWALPALALVADPGATSRTLDSRPWWRARESSTAGAA